MPFFPEINEAKTKENAKKIFTGYPRWRRVDNDKNGQKVTTTYSFMPRNPGSDTTSQVEKLAIRKVDAELELDAIEQAVSELHDPCGTLSKWRTGRNSGVRAE